MLERPCAPTMTWSWTAIFMCRQDIVLTKELIEAGRHMKIAVHDHVIVGAQGRSSMRALGLI